MTWFVSTERLGWPTERWWRHLTAWVPGEFQGRLQYEVERERPTAECHLQAQDEEPAACGYPWEGLVRVPGDPAWRELHPDLRCEDCETAAGIENESRLEHTSLYPSPADTPTGRSGKSRRERPRSARGRGRRF